MNLPDQLPLPEDQSTSEEKTDKIVSFANIDLLDEENLRPAQYQEFYVPIHEFIRFSEEELAIINHPSFQRLGKVYQLGQSHYVYRGASHKRFEHVLGTVHVAQMMIDAVAENYRRAQYKGQINDKCKFSAPFNSHEIRFIRLAALLHDIGHLPVGHTLEDELCLLGAHDADKRIELVFNKTNWIAEEVSTRLGVIIDDSYSKFVPKGLDIKPCEIVRLLISKDAKPEHLPRSDGKLRFSICRDVVGNTICADLLDYLYRDWYHVGKPRFFEKRLFQYMQIREESPDTGPEFVISYGQRNRPKRDAISAILELLESRYNLSETVLFHPTKCGAAAMLERGIFELAASIAPDKRQGWINSLADDLLSFSDEQALQHFETLASQRKAVSAKQIFQSLISRRLYKSIMMATVDFDKLQTRLERQIAKKYLGITNFKTKESTLETRAGAASARMEALRLLERDFFLASGSLALYCPPFKMNAKIAEVKIEKSGAIMTLNEWDESDEKLAGGHCAAQVRRFKGLWRMEAFIRDSERQELQKGDGSKWRAFQRAVRIFIFGMMPDNIGTEEEAVIALIKELAAIPKWKYTNANMDFEIAARGKRETYPLGGLPLISFLPKNALE
jgi:HD superfamily phosphohydrolase